MLRDMKADEVNKRTVVEVQTTTITAAAAAEMLVAVVREEDT